MTVTAENFYRHSRINGRLQEIRSATGEIMYLVEGAERAALIDTCLGVGNIKKTAEAMTERPITALLSHGHVDHAMGAPLFGDVYMNHADDEVYRAHSPVETRAGYIEANLAAAPGTWRNADFVPPAPPSKYKNLEDGMVFDLGGTHVEAHALPGHTPGCMVFLIPEEKLLITGDAANNSVFLFDEFSLPVETYKKNLLRVIKRLDGRYDHCYMMHHDRDASGELLSRMVDVCDDIIAGKADDMPFSFMGGNYFVAKNADERFKRLDGSEGNIIYNKAKVFAGGSA